MTLPDSLFAPLDWDGTTTIELPIPPSANRYWRHVTSGGRGLTLISSAGRNYQEAVRARCQLYRIRKIHGPVAVKVVWFREKKTGDLDNRLKPLLDALKHVAFGDDGLVRRIEAEMIDGDRRPRVAVVIAPYEFKGTAL